MPAAWPAVIGRPDPHRTLAQRRSGSPIKSQAWRGGEHAAEPEPTREPVWLPHRRRPPRPSPPPSLARSPIGRCAKCRWGYRSWLRPDEATGMPPGLNQALFLPWFSFSLTQQKTGAYWLRMLARMVEELLTLSFKADVEASRCLGSRVSGC